MKVNSERFVAGISDKLRELSGDDPKFLQTLTEYVAGLLKYSENINPVTLKHRLSEFLEDDTAGFVTWLLRYIDKHAPPASHPRQVLSTVQRAGQPLTRMRSVVSTPRPSGRERDGATPMDVDQAGPKEIRERSRSPVAAGRGASTIFQAAMRKAAPNNLQIKQELFAAPSVQATLALDRSAKRESMPASARTRNGHHDPAGGGFLRQASVTGKGPAGLSMGDSLAQQMGMNGLGLPQGVEPHSVVVSNIHFEATPEQVGIFFTEAIGGVKRVTILKNAHGFPKGYAYMELSSPELALQARALNGIEFLGREVKVTPKYKKPPAAAAAAQQGFLQMMMYSGAPPWGGHSNGRGGGRNSTQAARGRGRGGRGGRGSGRGRGRTAVTVNEPIPAGEGYQLHTGKSDVWVRGQPGAQP